jgi:hypothetical protein
VIGEDGGTVFVRPDLPGSTRAQCPPPRPDPHALNTAADQARRLYPGPVGEAAARWLETTRDLGWAGPDGLSARLVEALGDEAACRADAGEPVPAPSDRTGRENAPARVEPDPPSRTERFRAAFGGGR